MESYRDKGDKGKVKQRVKKYLSREIDGKPVRRARTSNIGVESVKRYGDIYVWIKYPRIFTCMNSSKRTSCY